MMRPLSDPGRRQGSLCESLVFQCLPMYTGDMTATMTQKAHTVLDGLSWQYRDATLDLLDIARGGVATRKYGAQLIVAKRWAVQYPDGTQGLTAEGLAHLTKTFS